MKKKSTFILLATGAIMGLAASLFTGCGSGDYYGTSGYVSTGYGYGYGMHDPFFYDPWYGHGGGTVIVTPPPSRPRPTPLPATRPSTRPAPIPRAR